MVLKNITESDLTYLINNVDLKFKSTHTRLSLPIINRIYKKMKANLKFPPIKIQHDFICDGHHRYLASLLAGYNLEITLWETARATTTIDWKTVSFDENDWDTYEEICQINLQDAAYNSIPLERILALLQ